MLTDPGGFQPASRRCEGDVWRHLPSHIDGSLHRFARKLHRCTEDLGGHRDVLRRRPSRWTAATTSRRWRTHACHAARPHRPDQALFGTSSGIFADLRIESARTALDSRLCIGGLSVGETAEMYATLDAVAGLPADRPLYLMGVGARTSRGRRPRYRHLRLRAAHAHRATAACLPRPAEPYQQPVTPLPLPVDRAAHATPVRTSAAHSATCSGDSRPAPGDGA